MKVADKEVVSSKVDKPKRTRTTRKIEIAGSAPTEDQIRSKAREIYLERVQNGESGTPETDWFEALKFFNIKK